MNNRNRTQPDNATGQTIPVAVASGTGRPYVIGRPSGSDADRLGNRTSEQTCPVADALLGDGLTDVKGAAEFLAVSRTTVYGLMETGQLRYVKIGKARRIPRRALVELAAANLRGGWADASGPAGSASPPDTQLEG